MGVAKLADFGNCMTEGLCQFSEVGTPLYMAPEVWAGTYDKSVDIFAFGMLLWTLVKGGHPITPDLPGDAYRRLHYEALSKWRPREPANCPPICWNVIQRCWKEEPKNRPEIQFVIDELERAMTDL